MCYFSVLGDVVRGEFRVRTNLQICRILSVPGDAEKGLSNNEYGHRSKTALAHHAVHLPDMGNCEISLQFHSRDCLLSPLLAFWVLLYSPGILEK